MSAVAPSQPSLPRTRGLDLVLGADPAQRLRLARAGAAMAVFVLAVGAVMLAGPLGLASRTALRWWGALTLLGMLGFLLLIRSGWSRRLREPSMTVPQMVYALVCGAVGYTLLGPARATVLPVMMLVLMAGLFVASPRQMRWVAAFGVLSFGLAMAVAALGDAAGYPWRVELVHFAVVAAVMPAVSMLAARLSRIRHRARLQRAELAHALSRLRESTTRDELTGLTNRRHMQELMAQEHKRCIRSGQPFCVAVLDVDRFKPVNEAHGYAVGDAVLRALAQEAQRHVRASDCLARWGGEEFVLLMSDARASLARGGLERLLQRLHALRIVHGSTAVGVTLSAGLAEHHAGEDVVQTLARAERALHEAKSLGPGRIVAAA